MKKKLERWVRDAIRGRVGGSSHSRYRYKSRSKRNKTSLRSSAKGRLKNWLERRIKRLFD